MITTMIEKPPRQNPALKSFWKRRARNRVLYGGRTSSKSWDAAIEAMKLADHYPLRILCTRQFQNKIEESVYTLLKKQIQRFNLTSRFYILKNKITGRQWNSEFMFYGLWRHIEEIKSLEDVDILWIEEAHALTEEQWEILEPTIRKEGSQVWLVFNPRYVNDFVYQRFVVSPPPNTVIRHINYDENPYLSNTAKEIIENKKKADPDMFRHIYLGEPLTDDESVLIRADWIRAAIGFDVKRGAKIVGYDVADSGDDKNATCIFDGGMCLDTDQWSAREDEATKSCKRVYNQARGNNAEIIYDSIGVGSHVGSMLNDMGHRNHSKFNAGAKVIKPKMSYNGIKNNEFFANLKAQSWWLVADRFRNTYNCKVNGQKFKPDELIGIDPNCSNLEQLIFELSTPKRDFDKLGRVKVESKQDLLARGVKSPNLADAFIMGASKGLIGSSTLSEVTVKGF